MSDFDETKIFELIQTLNNFGALMSCADSSEAVTLPIGVLNSIGLQIQKTCCQLRTELGIY